jgi:hypothetical protein
MLCAVCTGVAVCDILVEVLGCGVGGGDVVFMRRKLNVNKNVLASTG